MQLYKANKSVSWWVAWLVGLSIIWALIFCIILVNLGTVILHYIGAYWAFIFFIALATAGAAVVTSIMSRIKGWDNGSIK